MTNDIVRKKCTLFGERFGNKVYYALISIYHETKEILMIATQFLFWGAVLVGGVYYTFPLCFGDNALYYHNEVIARTSEIPDESGKLRKSTTRSGIGIDCIITVQYYEAKNNIFFHEYPVFQNSPDRIETIPCSSPK
ncbi:MAG: hypothetical protein PHN60_01075 [Candidatus Gracilibacteria bacterium]|nr:hypothetical protein [Candidatus Gracilibacteria bacterium]